MELLYPIFMLHPDTVMVLEYTASLTVSFLIPVFCGLYLFYKTCQALWRFRPVVRALLCTVAAVIFIYIFISIVGMSMFSTLNWLNHHGFSGAEIQSVLDKAHKDQEPAPKSGV